MWTSQRTRAAGVTVAAALAVTLAACAPGLGGDDETAAVAVDASTSQDASAQVDDPAGSTPAQMASADGSASDPTIVTDTVPAAGDGTADVLGCTGIDEETIEIELQNSTTDLVSYWLTVGFYDDADARLGDTSAFVNFVRPGERVREQSYVFEEDTAGATSCRVLNVDRTADSVDADLLASASNCQITGEDFVGDVEGTVSVTNGGDELSDFSITVAIIGSDGARSGTGNGYVEAVAAGETAPTDVYTTVPFADGQQCDVVAVERYDP